MKLDDSICTFLLVEDSQNVNFVLPYIKIDAPKKKFHSFKEADSGFAKYAEQADLGFMFHLIIIGAELKKGPSGIELM